MCTRTKTTYGCGCSFKHTDECHSSRCNHIDRFRIERDGDCRECRAGGAYVTRGREGKGRYAQAISRRSSSNNTTNSSGKVDVSGGASPWAPAPAGSRQRDEWHSPTRQKADSAWEEEHEARIQDLSERAEKLSIHESSSPRPGLPRSRSYESDRDRVQVQVDDRDYRSRRSGPASRRLFAEMTNSRESVNSVPARLKSISRSKRDEYDSGYNSGSYDSRRSNRRSRTDPYAYSPVTSRTVYEIPYGYSGGVEVYPSDRYSRRY